MMGPGFYGGFMTLSRGKLAAAGLALVAAAVPAMARERPALPGVQTRPAGPGAWLVSARADIFSDRSPRDVAMYSAAQLAESGGFAYFQVLRIDLPDAEESELLGDLADLGGARVELKIRGVADRAAPIHCEMPRGAGCSVHPVAETLRALGFRLGLRPATPAAPS
jgi:hypothetical protein